MRARRLPAQSFLATWVLQSQEWSIAASISGLHSVVSWMLRAFLWGVLELGICLSRVKEAKPKDLTEAIYTLARELLERSWKGRSTTVVLRCLSKHGWSLHRSRTTRKCPSTWLTSSSRFSADPWVMTGIPVCGVWRNCVLCLEIAMQACFGVTWTRYVP